MQSSSANPKARLNPSKTTARINLGDLNGLIVTNPYNILYLSGFRGISPTERESILVITSTRSHPARISAGKDLTMSLIVPRLYQAEAKKLESPNLKIKIAAERDQMQKFIFELLKNCQKIGFEQTNLTVAELEDFKKLLPGKDLIATKNLIENLRLVKTDEEVEKIKKAQTISQKALAQILPTIAAGQTEMEIANKLESAIFSMSGSKELAFGTIVASGPNSGIPHHLTDNRKIKRGDTLLFDFGAKYQYYCADLSRTVFVGKPTTVQANVYTHVAKAQNTAIAKIAKEIKMRDAYNLAADIFKNENLQDYFTHGLGHGVGLEVHEPPYLRPNSPDEDLLQENMVFSVEPGLYFGWGGVRIEDLVVVKNSKAQVLGKEQKELITV